MGKLVLTRRAGESVIVREANGDEWALVVVKIRADFISLRMSHSGWEDVADIPVGRNLKFLTGHVELLRARCPSQAILAFDFPRDVTILRTEIA